MSDHEQDSGPTSFHKEGGAVIFDKPKSQEEIARQRREDEQHEFARSQVNTNKTLAWFTGALVLATFCTIGVGIWQGFISQKAANAAKEAVGVASRTLEETQRSNARQAQLAEQARRDASAAAEANSKQANASLQTTIDNFHQEQRPWIVPVGLVLPYEPDETKDPVTKVTFANVGKTPAIETFSLSQVDAGPNQPAFPIRDSDKKVSRGFGTIPPGIGTYSYETSNTGFGQNLHPDVLTAYRAGNETIFVFGKFFYKDVVGNSHWTTFCVAHRYGRPLDEYDFCLSGNDVDRPLTKQTGKQVTK